jgi:hypothetical protein
MLPKITFPSSVVSLFIGDAHSPPPVLFTPSAKDPPGKKVRNHFCSILNVFTSNPEKYRLCVFWRKVSRSLCILITSIDPGKFLRLGTFSSSQGKNPGRALLAGAEVNRDGEREREREREIGGARLHGRLSTGRGWNASPIVREN